VTGTGSYTDLAGEYDALLGALAEQTWHRGILAEVNRLGWDRHGLVVDLGAGTGIGGRLLAAEAGATRLIAVDDAEPMLARAAPYYERLLLSDIANVALPDASADLVVCGFDTLNYLNPVQLASCFESVSRLLHPAGWLVFDYSSPQLLRCHWRDLATVDQLPEGTLHWRHRFDADLGYCLTTVERRDIVDRTVWREEHIQYALDTAELQALAATAGMRVDRVRDLDRAEFSPAAHTHVWTLLKEA
jgi:SAM-dependent methyltransferase